MRAIAPFVVFLSLLLSIHVHGAASLAVAGPLSNSIQIDKLIEGDGKPPSSFEASLGQTEPSVKFLSRNSRYSFNRTASEAALSPTRQGAIQKTTPSKAKVGIQTLATVPQASQIAIQSTAQGGGQILFNDI